MKIFPDESQSSSENGDLRSECVDGLHTATCDHVRKTETADLLRPLFHESDGKHGLVSPEVSPHLARDTDQTITTLFLDIGAVLLTNGWDRHSRARAAERFHLDIDEMHERHHLTFDTYEEGKLTLDSYLDRVVFYGPRDFSRDEFKEFMFAQAQPFPEMIELIRAVTNQYGLRTVAVSNEGRELTVRRISQFQLATFIDVFISSCFTHFRKPDADMFQIALDVVQAQPQHVVYLDDREMFVEVARGLGIQALWHRNSDTTRSALAEYGLVVAEDSLASATH